MRVLGLIGGMSWESTELYYRAINKAVSQQLGGLHSAALLLSSVDFAELEALLRNDAWDAIGERLVFEAKRLEHAGAEALVLCTNTMHRLAAPIEAAVAIPLLHIADATAVSLKRVGGIDCVGLLGTRFTMQADFYVSRLRDKHGFDVLVPDESQQAEVDRIIFEELCLGTVIDPSREYYQRVISELVERGAQAVILGCTEIGMLVPPDDTSIPLVDTMHAHSAAAVEFALHG
ncbi:MAG: aspartate/glutamate racemase family protein [Pseudomonadota bacterium]